MNEGSIKFNCGWIQEPCGLSDDTFHELEKYRALLIKRKLIGVYPDGIGYGNISCRDTASAAFFITGSGTGHLGKLTPEQYSMVLQYNFFENSLICRGMIRASAESLTHAAIYESDPGIGAVAHVHNPELWEKLLNRVPTTPEAAEYGTPEIAFAVKKLAEKPETKGGRLIVMGGHKEGILTFGKNLEEATLRILQQYNDLL
jgi:ribulose-5-phosphate 4-epimerase/fuculose-1-phosphate aldolase